VSGFNTFEATTYIGVVFIFTSDPFLPSCYQNLPVHLVSPSLVTRLLVPTLRISLFSVHFVSECY